MVPMLTWSSLFAEVGMESTLAGCASTLFSDTSAAAVYCAIMNPEFRPESATRNAGRPLSVRVDQPLDAALRDVGELRRGHAEVVRGQGHGLAVEVAPQQELARAPRR